jgi:hypothetical protein
MPYLHSRQQLIELLASGSDPRKWLRFPLITELSASDRMTLGKTFRETPRSRHIALIG